MAICLVSISTYTKGNSQGKAKAVKEKLEKEKAADEISEEEYEEKKGKIIAAEKQSPIWKRRSRRERK